MSNADNEELEQTRYEHAVANLRAQMELEGRAQTRAATFSGFFFAGATLIAISILERSDMGVRLTISLLAAAGCLYVGAWLCSWAALPGLMHDGNENKAYFDWMEEHDDGTVPLKTDMRRRAERYFVVNREAAFFSRRRFSVGTFLGYISPLVMIVTYFVFPLV